MKTVFCTALLIFTAALTVQAQSVKNETIKIAQSSAVVIDGRIEEKEWQNAPAFDLTGGGKVFFKHDGDYLYVGVRGVNKGWGHLYLSQGDNLDVSVLHASAALGMTVYSADKNKIWQSSNPFAWELRDKQITPETRKKMSDYLSKNFWVANNVNMGSLPEIEFQVKPRNPLNKSLYVAVVYSSDAKNLQFFPAALKDDSLAMELVRGNTPPDLKFDRNEWAKISLEGKRK